MRKVLVIAGVVLACVRSADATNYGIARETCPIDGTAVTGWVPRGSTFSPGSSHDFRPYYTDTFTLSILRCPTCGFTAHHGRFDDAKTLIKDKDALKKALAPTRGSFLGLFDAAVLVERALTDDPELIAHMKLAAKWRADDTGEPEAIRARTDDAIAALRSLLATKKTERFPQEIIEYLLGELHRQRGDLPQAVEWFDKSAKGEEPPYFLKGRRLCARLAMIPSERWADELAKADPEAIDDATPFLMQSDDERVQAFLRKHLLAGKDGAREEIFDSLNRSAMTPRWRVAAHKRLIPLCRAATESKNAGAVLWGLGVLAELDEALLLERFRWFISAADRDPPVETLVSNWIRHPEWRKHKDVNDAMLQWVKDGRITGDEAVVVLVRIGPDVMVDRLQAAIQDKNVTESGLRNYDVFKDLASFGTALTDRLPDPVDASGSDSARIKCAILAASGKRESLDKVAAFLRLGGRTAWESAVLLLRAGDPRGREFVMARLETFVSKQGWDVPLLLPLLRPADFDAVHAVIRKQSAEHEKRRQEIRRTLASAVGEARRNAESQLLSEDDSIASFHSDWYPLASATRHPEAKALLLRGLTQFRDHARGAAIAGLADYYDKEVGDRLMALLGEHPEEVMTAVARAGDRRHVPAFLELVRQPTGIAFKSVWIQAMEKLDPRQAEPFLRRWAESPDLDLAGQARESLKRSAGK